MKITNVGWIFFTLGKELDPFKRDVEFIVKVSEMDRMNKLRDPSNADSSLDTSSVQGSLEGTPLSLRQCSALTVLPAALKVHEQSCAIDSMNMTSAVIVVLPPACTMLELNTHCDT